MSSMPEEQSGRKRVGIGAALMVAAAVAALFFFSLMICDPWEAYHGVSETMEQAKENGVFIAEYLPTEDPYVFGDSIRFRVREAWLERRWWGSNRPFSEIEVDWGYQLAMVIDGEELDGYGTDWQIGVDSHWYLDRSYRGLYKRELEEPPGDRVEWPVQAGNWFTDSTQRKILGRFVLALGK